MTTSFIFQVIQALVWVLYGALIGRVVISWINLSPSNPIVTVIYQVTEPILAPIRRVLPKMGALDLSPMIAIILITVVQRLLRGLLLRG